MPLTLSEYDRACLAGDLGPACQFAMSILVRMAEIYEAEELLDISRAHIDSSLYQGDATLEFAERLVSMNAKVSVPSTLNVSGVDEHGWKEWSVPPDWAEKARRQMVAYQSMGCEPTWTCTPYQTATKPEFGEQIAWGESNAVAYANSVLGARTEQYPDLLDICAAITGRVPAAGLHLTENRAGELLLRLVDVPEAVQADDSFGAVLGHLMGKLSGTRVPVIEGITVEMGEDQLKVCHKIPDSDLASLSSEQRQARLDNDEPFCFGHTLTDQVGGQIDAGLAITGLFEDCWPNWPISEYIPTSIVTKATKRNCIV
jgi:predicted aconitase